MKISGMAALLATAFLLGMKVSAQNLELIEFSEGQPARASDLNENFQKLEGALSGSSAVGFNDFEFDEVVIFFQQHE